MTINIPEPDIALVLGLPVDQVSLLRYKLLNHREHWISKRRKVFWSKEALTLVQKALSLEGSNASPESPAVPDGVIHPPVTPPTPEAAEVQAPPTPPEPQVPTATATYLGQALNRHMIMCRIQDRVRGVYVGKAASFFPIKGSPTFPVKLLDGDIFGVITLACAPPKSRGKW